MPWNAAKSKVQLRLSIQRLRILQQKKEAQAKAARRDIATLLERGKIETARVKVESIINEDIHVELLELLELYCELLLARKSVVENRIQVSGKECVVSYMLLPGQSSKSPELHVLRDLLMHKYGREFSLAVMENRDGCVSDRVKVVRKLDMSTPSLELVDGYLTEIAKAYSVEWAPIRKSAQDGPGPSEGGVKEPGKDTEKSAIKTHENEVADQSAAESTNSPPIEGNSCDPKDRASGIPPSQHIPLKGSAAPPYTPEPVDEDDFEALARRFKELKKR